MIACPQCGHSTSQYVQARDYNRHISDEIFTWYHCDTCGLIFLFPIPTNLSDYYPASYYRFPATLKDFAPQTDPQKYKIDLIKPFTQHGRLLEVGPGPGDFAYLAKQAGFSVDVIEMDERCCQFLSNVIGVHAVNSAEPVSAIQTMGQYDVIALWHVIEHLTDPWAVLDALSNHLNPGGILLIAAPNPQSLQFRLFSRWWTHLDSPRHIQLIPMQLLSQRLEKQGCRPVLMTTTDKGSLGWNRFGWEYSLSNLIGRKVSMRYPGAVLNRLFAPLERSGWRGSTYTVIFQR